MPSGRTHDRITLWSLPWIVGCTYILTRQGDLTLIVAASFLFSGLMFGPDLDIYSIQYQRWGKLRWIWLPYQTILNHRSLFSHGFIIGTIGRLFYLSTVVTLIAIPGVAVAQWIAGFNWNWQGFVQNTAQSVSGKYTIEALALFVGLELGAMSHYLSDWLGSAYKRSQKRRRKSTTPKR